ncbi:protein-methionine-sulfoxide reductase catalytic subunit MsrP [Methylocapsa acidiphila]|uniref:protein-methionine-sulfoxide reductase catalytic subunit MsrP n=1 Tax=Methylocapsa acidiphila TaxID=133552 RepID=UPI00041699FB|nr:protein-methionine-sulfoxide reductase catalytic subunit MsrP [Methylocapsa acidiphila]
MVIRRSKGWEIPERHATPEHVFFARRTVLKGVAAASAVGVLGALPTLGAPDSSGAFYPAKRNEAFALDRPVTPEAVNTRYNNFYEFGSSKSIADAAESLKVRPWTVKIDGRVGKPQEIAIDDLLKRMPLEERLYRHRCVEAWSMAVPWTGFPLRALIEAAEPQAGANYVRFETFLDRAVAPGQRQFWYPWPYVEGLTLAEASNDLAFLVTGAYGKPLPKSMGAPLRLATPWKYGFKSIKSITRISLVAERPKTFWEQLGPSEYGFWANVNPMVPHPRWSQANEEVLGTHERRPTELYNGYGEFVAGLYSGLEGERLFM